MPCQGVLAGSIITYTSNVTLKERESYVKKKITPWLFLAPVLLSLLMLFGYPLVRSFIMAFQNYKLTNLNDVYFVGFDNFVKVFTTPETGMVFKNSLIWVITSVVGQLIFGMILALALRKPFKGRGIYQSIVFLPWAVSGFVVGLIFRFSFNGEYGIVNNLLLKFGLIDEKVSWLSTPGLSLAVPIIAMIWIGIPFFAINILAALQSIPADVYEAADVDGCGAIRQFFQITLPYIKPTLITTVLLRTIWIFNAFELIMVITDGGPANTSQTLTSYMYAKAFSNYDLGHAAALGVVMMICMCLYALFFLKVTNYNKAGDF